VTWQGWESYSNTEDDTLDAVSAEQLEESGRTLALALMVAAREVKY
jgi:hypothetical protein